MPLQILGESGRNPVWRWRSSITPDVREFEVKKYILGRDEYSPKDSLLMEWAQWREDLCILHHVPFRILYGHVPHGVEMCFHRHISNVKWGVPGLPHKYYGMFTDYHIHRSYLADPVYKVVLGRPVGNELGATSEDLVRFGYVGLYAEKDHGPDLAPGEIKLSINEVTIEIVRK